MVLVSTVASCASAAPSSARTSCYAATSERAAGLESVLHDVQLDPPGVFSLADLAH